MFDLRTVISVLALTFAPTHTLADPVAARESAVQIIDERELTTNPTTAFAEFKADSNYYGAFYVSQNGGFAWRSNLNTLDAAKLLTFQRCAETGTNCQIYATLNPKRPRLAEIMEGVSKTRAAEAESWAIENAKDGRSVVIAASGYAGWAGWRGRQSMSTLRTSALNHCLDRLRPRLEALADNQRSALADAGLLDCKIIMTKSPR